MRPSQISPSSVAKAFKQGETWGKSGMRKDFESPVAFPFIFHHHYKLTVDLWTRIISIKISLFPGIIDIFTCSFITVNKNMIMGWIRSAEVLENIVVTAMN